MHRNEPIKGEKVCLESMAETDLPELWTLIYNQEQPGCLKWDTTHIPAQHKDFEKFRDQQLNLLKHGLDKQFLIKTKKQIIGVVSYDWEHESSNSIEVCIKIYRKEYLKKDFELDALKATMNYLFMTTQIPRISLSTWSGNDQLLNIGEELGLTVEGAICKNRGYNGKYYEIVKMGILREEWEEKYLQLT
ncbi:GNAT family protein [Bacillus sp. B15-48]|uniref:GNAT family N-acetyltransferase n=1 Tax=Bacillus sp. B15-48 TaxID=1548601 RepID=UPI00193F427C|nr:GNAT family protein [Bacillus sp. B15-48]